MSALTEYLQKEVIKGFSKNAIIGKLLKAGYKREKIEQAFAEIDKKESVISQASKKSIVDKEAITKWAAIVVLILVIIAGTYLVINKFMAPEETKEKKAVDISKCNKLVDTERDNCILETAKELDNGEVCREIIEKTKKNMCSIKVWVTNNCLYQQLLGKETEDCFAEQALVSKEINDCYMVRDVEGCLLQLALQENSITYCNDQIECVVAFAKEKNNQEVCEEVDETSKMFCKQIWSIGDNE